MTRSINDLINVYTSAAPGQNECDNAIRAIQSSRHLLENATQPTSDLSYYECLDTVMEKSKALGDGKGSPGAREGVKHDSGAGWGACVGARGAEALRDAFCTVHSPPAIAD